MTVACSEGFPSEIFVFSGDAEQLPTTKGCPNGGSAARTPFWLPELPGAFGLQNFLMFRSPADAESLISRIFSG